jgi:hypothetical protein
MLSCRLPALVEVVQACSEFKEPRALAASKLAGSSQVVGARLGVCMSVRPRPQQFRVVEAHAGFRSELQRPIETRTGVVWLLGGGQELPEDAPVEGPICAGSQGLPYLDHLSKCLDVGW